MTSQPGSFVNTTQTTTRTEIIKRRQRYLASMKLEGIELPEKTLAMFDLFDAKDFTAEQELQFIKEFYGYS